MTKKSQFGASFQRSIVACFTRLPEFAGRFRDLITEDVINDPDLAEIVKATHEVIAITGGALPTKASLENKLPKKKAIIRDLYAVDVRDQKYVAEEVAKFCKFQACKAAVFEVAKMLKAGDENIMEPLQKAMMVGADSADIGEFLKSGLRERIAEYLHPELVQRVPTGMTLLDALMGGGLEPGELGVVMAPAKRGKSFLLANMGYGCSSAGQGNNLVMHYSLEMKQRKILKRYDYRIAGSVSEHHKTQPEKFVSTLGSNMGRFIGGNVLVKSYPTRTMTKSIMASHLSRVIGLGHQPRMIIVDYGDIMKAERRMGEMRHEQASCFEDLRQLAGEFNVPIWTATQANKASMRKSTIDMDDVGEAWEKIQIADAVLGICQTPEEKAESIARIHFMALREEKSGMILKMKCDLGRALFHPLEIVHESKPDMEKKGDKVIERAQERAKKFAKDRNES